jgi:hypothetical protein
MLVATLKFLPVRFPKHLKVGGPNLLDGIFPQLNPLAAQLLGNYRTCRLGRLFSAPRSISGRPESRVQHDRLDCTRNHEVSRILASGTEKQRSPWSPERVGDESS